MSRAKHSLHCGRKPWIADGGKVKRKTGSNNNFKSSFWSNPAHTSQQKHGCKRHPPRVFDGLLRPPNGPANTHRDGHLRHLPLSQMLTDDFHFQLSILLLILHVSINTRYPCTGPAIIRKCPRMDLAIRGVGGVGGRGVGGGCYFLCFSQAEPRRCLQRAATYVFQRDHRYFLATIRLSELHKPRT